ncbi:MAG TPA: hypothetical protein VHW64_10255 [Nocardioides sp.]|uniref:hypothetical protein n=1 Tax=Nocardioides sp. TaxID=35761 RepID=UPI002E331051|nr:hypothetical protein [Nocardioides sp.]HEX3931079.1 hypothetical protein [Nocardioides sp.]
MTSPTRLVVGAAGLGVGAYGVLRLLELGLVNLRGAVTWLAGGVVLHDAVFAPLVLVVALVGARLLPRRWLAPVTVALVVLVPVTLLSLPELGRFGADPRNDTLLDRHYWWGWSVLSTLVVLTVLATALTRAALTRRGGDHGARDGGR